MFLIKIFHKFLNLKKNNFQILNPNKINQKLFILLQILNQSKKKLIKVRISKLSSFPFLKTLIIHKIDIFLYYFSNYISI